MNKNEKIIKEWADDVRTDLGFTKDIKDVVYIWNPGGFVNQSYFLTDGEVKRHVKFAESNHESELRKWSRVSDYLNTYYHAPKLIKEVEEEVIPGFSYGLVSEYFDGAALKTKQEQGTILTSILENVSQLHQDKDLGNLLESRDELTYADSFIDTYITRFREDLSIIDGHQYLLSFVTKETYQWFHEEVDRLEKEVKNMKSFQAIARDVTHNDLSSQNILVNRERFCIIDWDDLSCQGDAAMDYTSLLWPLAQSKKWEERVSEVAGDKTVERLSLYFRAKLLDEVIDVLADYVEAEEMPEVKEKTQKRAEKIHLQAYRKYRLLYG
ncbi:Phosphotransferase enzyme family protein [Halobacillus dabanensis]|uniref:Phosphotransferase enzyme family protein n=1 Tax=Halobacillus dabanensis TaxID=240302 RepID=A0A1I3TAG0_HALDA|nr:aminoglycoside phosphotransferase family protein [Halobacillus dabanensis]SFJ67925.1 Phosphotransferase enzyme family protein [Halobacillus dabanensis]